MTRKVKEIIDEIEKELDELPAEKQVEYATSYLNDLRRRKQQAKADRAEPYSSFRVLKEATFSGEPDESTAYERKLYGLNKDDG